MTLESPELTFNAIQYASNRTPLKIEKDSIALTKVDGGYSVKPCEILIKVHSAALNPVDIVLYNSAHPLISRIKGGALQGIGRDYSGTIVEIGDIAKSKYNFNVSDKVCGLYRHPFGKGTVSEYILLDPSVDPAITKLPKNASFEEAASWPLVYGTALQMIETAGINLEEVGATSRVLVIGGATSVGRYVIQLCKNVYNVKDVVAICSNSSSDMVKSLGADSTIDYKVHPNIFAPVSEYAAQNGKFDAVFDCCGNSDLFTNMSAILKSCSSHYVTIQGDSKGDYETVNMANAVKKNLGLAPRMLKNSLGFLGYKYKLLMLEPGEWIHEGKKNIEDGNVKIQIDSVHKLNDFSVAYERLKSNRASGKIVINLE